MLTKTFTITANRDMMMKIERFLAWLHFNTKWGHSATIAIDCDGDGDDSVDIQEDETFSIQEHREYVKNIRAKKKDVEWITCD